MDFDIVSYLEERKKEIEKYLHSYFLKEKFEDTVLEKSIRYSLFAGGKRLRPVLCLAASESLCGDYKRALPVACALEMIHTYSLIHDDLPCMDDDDLRRGKPTNHKVYGEGIAVLAGDALLTEAFWIVGSEGLRGKLSPEKALKIVREISRAAGRFGMIKGQSMDISLEGSRDVNLETIELMHSLKTGAMIEASLVSGGIVGGANDEQLEQLRIFGKNLGLAFQIMDDILDIEGERDLGKKRGRDLNKSKVTYLSVLGLDESKAIVSKLTKKAVGILDNFEGNRSILTEIAFYLGQRNH